MESKKSLINENNLLRGQIKRLRNLLQVKNQLIYQLEGHLKYVRKKLDYLIEHPWSKENGRKNKKTY